PRFLHPKSPQPGGDARLPLFQEGTPTDEVALVERHRPARPGFERRAVLADVLPVQRVAHLKPKRVAGSQAAGLDAQRLATFHELAPEPARPVRGNPDLEPSLPRVARTGHDGRRSLVLG